MHAHLEDTSGRYAHAIRCVVGLHGSQEFHPIVKYEHYQIPSGARASLYSYYYKSQTHNIIHTQYYNGIHHINYDVSTVLSCTSNKV